MPRFPRFPGITINAPASLRRLAPTAAGALLALSLVGWPAANTLATDDEAIPAAPLLSIGQTASVATDRLHLRAEPNTEAESMLVMTTGQAGAVVDGPVDGEGYAWYQLEIDGVTGWSAGNFLEAASASAAADAAAVDASGAFAIGGDTGGLTVGATAVVNDDRVNLRAAAGLDAEILDKLDTGTVVSLLDGPIESDGYAWYQIDRDGVTGWVASAFLGSGESAAEIVVGATVVVNDDRVNLRDGAGIDAGILAKLTTGQTGTVVDGPVDADDYTWYFIDIDGESGWVAGVFLSAA